MTPYEFLSTAWRDKAGYGFLCFKNKEAWEGLHHWKDYPVKLPLSEPAVEEAMGNYPPEEYDWYFSPCTFSEPHRQARYANETDLLWADVDEGDVNLLGKKPYLHWRTSKGRSSALWRQDHYVPAEVSEATNTYIAKKIHADKSGKDISQVLRVVGTFNHKPGKGNPVTLLSSSVERYDFREETMKGLFLTCHISDKAKEELGKAVESDSDRSTQIFRIAALLFEGGLSKAKVFELLQYSKWNKFEGNKDRLKEDLDRVWRKFNGRESDKIDREEELEGLEAFSLLDVESEDLSFLWDPYIPEGKITIIEGDPGLGKSWLTMKLAADLSCGRALPGSDPQTPRKILLLSAEDGLSDTIKPRLEVLKANFQNIFAVNKPVYITEPDMKRIRNICIEKSISVIVIDPLVAFMGGKIDLHKANQTRDIMARLARLGDELGVTIICIRHLTKGGKDKAIYRGLGSIDITGAARSVLAIGRDPSNPYTGRVICHIKSNLAREGLSLLYYLDDKAEPFTWGEFTDDRAQDILAVDLQGHREKPEKEKEAEDLTEGMDEFRPAVKSKKKSTPMRDEDGFSWWNRKVRTMIKNGGGQKELEELLADAPGPIKDQLRQKYYNI